MSPDTANRIKEALRKFRIPESTISQIEQTGFNITDISRVLNSLSVEDTLLDALTLRRRTAATFRTIEELLKAETPLEEKSDNNVQQIPDRSGHSPGGFTPNPEQAARIQALLSPPLSEDDLGRESTQHITAPSAATLPISEKDIRTDIFDRPQLSTRAASSPPQHTRRKPSRPSRGTPDTNPLGKGKGKRSNL